MARMVVFVLVVLAFTINIALAASRTLPEKEKPLVVYHVFSSPVGEVQFAKSATDSTVFLRTSTGSVCRVVEILGSETCRKPREKDLVRMSEQRCAYLFQSEQNRDCAHRIFSYELKESSIFGVVRKVNRGKMGEHGTF